MPKQDFMLEVIDGIPGFGYACLRGLLTVASGLYRIGMTIDMVAGGTTKLPVEVISIGNLSVGGTGKTLAVLKLARELTAAGKKVAILSRGYGRRSQDAVAVVSTEDSVRMTPAEAGDEPSLLATSLPGVPVLVGKNRRVTGRYAIEHFHPDVLLLDDGFQYWRLHKDREIVLLDALQPTPREHLLPRGLFRVPWSHLRRASEVWITHADLATPSRLAHLQGRIAHYAPGVAVRYTAHRPLYLRDRDGAQHDLELLKGRTVLALSGLGNPMQFEQMLGKLGARVTPCRFRDHHPYAPADILAIQQQLAADMLLVTTPKDAIRLPHNCPMPVLVAEVELAEVTLPPPAGKR
jgi:tetraacyldisaccharide 4'-kinase